MKIPVAMYPFSSDLLPVVKFFEKFQNKYTLKKLFSPPGLGLAGKDAAYARNHPNIGITVADELDMNDSTWEVLLLTRPIDSKVSIDSELSDVAESALQAGKSVVYIDGSGAEIPEKFRELCPSYKEENHGYSWEKGIHIDAPVILVGGLMSEADSFEVLLGLAAKLHDNGLYTTCFINHPICDIFGFHNLGRILNKSNKDEAQKMAELIAYVKDLEITERPDVILVEAPDAVMRYSDLFPNGFGIRSYMVCQVIRPDYFVCCVPFKMANGALMDALSRDFETRLNVSINAVHVSNLMPDLTNKMPSLSDIDIIPYVQVNLDSVRIQIEHEGKNSQIPMYDVITEGIDGIYAILNENMSKKI